MKCIIVKLKYAKSLTLSQNVSFKPGSRFYIIQLNFSLIILPINLL